MRIHPLPLIILFLAALTHAAEPPPPPLTATPSQAAPTLPDTRAGKVMATVLAALADPSKPIPADLFAESFKAQVPPDKVAELTRQVIAQHGAFTLRRIDKEADPDNILVTIKGVKTGQALQVVLGLDKDGKIETLLLRPALDADAPPLADWAALDTELASLEGKHGTANFLAARLTLDGGTPRLEELHTRNPDARLAIGSTFKLYILGALAESVLAGGHAWDEPLAIQDKYKSLPSGTMQNEKEGAAFPLSRYAGQMIAISDNTATDHLLHLLGRGTVEDYMAGHHGKPTLNYPFLSTREMFALKLNFDPTLLDRWVSLGEGERRDMVVPDDPIEPRRRPGARHKPGEVANTVPELALASVWIKPRAIDKVEWFASPRELARVMADLARLETKPGMDELGTILRKNPGVPFDSAVWKRIAYKGGSEPGVLNLTWLLTRADGAMFVVTLGWNNPRALLDEAKLLALAPRAAALLAKAP